MNTMYPQVVYVEPLRPPAFFTCQKVTIIVLNAIAALVVAIYVIISLLAVLLESDPAALILLLVFVLIFGYFFAGIYGAFKENECVFLVYLIVNILGTVLSVGITIFVLVLVLWSLERKHTSDSKESISPRDLQAVFFSMAVETGWTAFLIVFARNLRQWNGQKRGGGGRWSGAGA